MKHPPAPFPQIRYPGHGAPYHRVSGAYLTALTGTYATGHGAIVAGPLGERFGISGVVLAGAAVSGLLMVFTDLSST